MSTRKRPHLVHDDCRWDRVDDWKWNGLFFPYKSKHHWYAVFTGLRDYTSMTYFVPIPLFSGWFFLFFLVSKFSNHCHAIWVPRQSFLMKQKMAIPDSDFLSFFNHSITHWIVEYSFAVAFYVKTTNIIYITPIFPVVFLFLASIRSTTLRCSLVFVGF